MNKCLTTQVRAEGKTSPANAYKGSQALDGHCPITITADVWHAFLLLPQTGMGRALSAYPAQLLSLLGEAKAGGVGADSRGLFSPHIHKRFS